VKDYQVPRFFGACDGWFMKGPYLGKMMFSWGRMMFYDVFFWGFRKKYGTLKAP
jgi:hypothetical protein